mgnify:CR=1 FL=1
MLLASSASQDSASRRFSTRRQLVVSSMRNLAGFVSKHVEVLDEEPGKRNVSTSGLLLLLEYANRICPLL